MRLHDVNVLVHAANVALTSHGGASRWLSESIDSGEGLMLAWVALLGFIRITTRPSICSKPLPTASALAVVDDWLQAPGARVVHPGPRHAALLGRLLTAAGTAGNLTTDAHLAALAKEHGAVVGTFDRDFSRLAGIRVDWLGATG